MDTWYQHIGSMNLPVFMALILPLTHWFICLRKSAIFAGFLHSIMNDITVGVDKDYRRNIAASFSRFQHKRKFLGLQDHSWNKNIVLSFVYSLITQSSNRGDD